MRYVRILSLLFIVCVGVIFLHATPVSAQLCDEDCRRRATEGNIKPENNSGGTANAVRPIPQCPAGYTRLYEEEQYRGPLLGTIKLPAGCYKDGKRNSGTIAAQYTCSDPVYKYDPTSKTCYHPSRPPAGSGIASEQQKADQTYEQFGGALDESKNAYFAGKGARYCSSQGCDTKQWTKLVHQCVEQARTTIVGAGRYGQKIDEDKQKDLFSSCLSTASGVSKDDIRENTRGVDFNKVFGGNAAAGEKACIEAGGTWKAPNCEIKKEDGSAPYDEDNTISCSIEDGMGWLVCPVMRFLANVMDSSFDFLSSHFLKTDVRLLDDSRGQTEQAWNMMRQFANITFVVIFLVIIYSQITGAGIGTYHIKTMLPRLLIAAILVNVSFILCKLAIDVSNILGFSLKEFFDGLGRAIMVGDVTDTTASAGTKALSAVSTMAVVLGAVGGAAALVMALSFPVLLTGVLALGLIALILIGRTALIIILTIIAPLAFAAWVLPNTRSLFNRWGKMFFSLLMLFPVISVVFGASNFVAGLLQGLSEEDNQGIMSLMALAVTSIPLFVVPGLLKGALNATGQIGAKLSGASSNLNSKVGSKVKDSSRLGEAWKNYKFKSIQRQANRRAGNSWIAQRGRSLAGTGGSRLTRGIGRVMSAKGDMTQALDSSKLGGLIGGTTGAAAAASIASKADNEQVEAAAILMKSGVDPSKLPAEAETKLRQAIAKGDSISARAAQKILLTSGAPGIQSLQTTLNSMEQSGVAKDSTVMTSLRQDLNAAGIKDKDAVLSTWAYNGQTIDATLNDAGTFSGLTATELAGQGVENIAQGVKSGGITQASYAEINKSDIASAKLTPKKRAEFAKAP